MNNINYIIYSGAGVSRSATIMIGYHNNNNTTFVFLNMLQEQLLIFLLTKQKYVMHTLSYSFEKSYQLVQDARSCIHPNRGFEYQLKLLEEIGLLLFFMIKKRKI